VCAINTAEAARINLDNKCKRSMNQVDSFSLLVFDGTLMYRWIIEKRYRYSLVFLARVILKRNRI
jgi:hypothetical protein